jgi:hypothetical protein
VTTYFPDGISGDKPKEPLKLLRVIPPTLQDIAKLKQNEIPAIGLVLNRGLTAYELEAMSLTFPEAYSPPDAIDFHTYYVQTPLSHLRDVPGVLALHVADISKWAAQNEAEDRGVLTEWEAAVEGVNKTLT